MRNQRKDPSSWLVDQLAKSHFFHRKLHEWGLLEVAEELDKLRGEEFEWSLETLGIQSDAWNRVIHSGIKPVLVFAHPTVLSRVPRSTAYYRMMAMVSQKSMAQIGLPVAQYEDGFQLPNNSIAQQIAIHLNQIISQLVREDTQLNHREFDLWRGLAAGTQAQGSWQNQKGRQIEQLIFDLIRQHARNFLAIQSEQPNELILSDGRKVQFASNPDITILSATGQPLVIVEVKGGIDPAGALERLGAAIKTFLPIKKKYPECRRIFLLRQNALTNQVLDQLRTNPEVFQVINEWFVIEELLNSKDKMLGFLQSLGLGYSESSPLGDA